MKKLLTALALVFTLAACSGGSGEPSVAHKFIAAAETGNTTAMRQYEDQFCISDNASVLCPSNDASYQQVVKTLKVKFKFVTSFQDGSDQVAVYKFTDNVPGDTGYVIIVIHNGKVHTAHVS